MRYRLRNAIIVATAVLTASLAAESASGVTARTWTVKPGGSVTAQGSATLTDTKTGTVYTCGSMKLTGTLKSGSGLSGPGVGSITGLTGTCTIAGAYEVTLTPHGLPWRLNALSYNSADSKTTGSLTGIGMTATGPACYWALDGTAAAANDGVARFTFANSTANSSY